MQKGNKVYNKMQLQFFVHLLTCSLVHVYTQYTL